MNVSYGVTALLESDRFIVDRMSECIFGHIGFVINFTVIHFVLVLVLAAGPLLLITEAVRLLMLLLLLLLPSYWYSCLCAATDNPLHCAQGKILSLVFRLVASLC